jgi:2-aminobenzoate-CoA ligase
MPQELAPSSHQDLFSRQHLPPADQWPVFLFDRPEVQYPDALNAPSAARPRQSGGLARP